MRWQKVKTPSVVLFSGPGFRAAFFAALVVGLVDVPVLVFARNSAALVLFCIVLVPFLAGLFLTRRFMDALLLTWINEMFFGGSGNWIAIGSFSGRWILFLVLLVAIGVSSLSRNRAARTAAVAWEGRIKAAILFWGAIFPFGLVLYSVGAMSTPIVLALKDISFLLVLLVYFPLRSFVARRSDVFMGYLVGACVGLSGLLILLALGPASLRDPIWMVMANYSEVRIGVTDTGVARAGMLSSAFLFIIVFLGVWHAISPGQTSSSRFLGILLAIIGLAPMVITFQRGPIVSAILVLGLMTLGMWTSRGRRIAGLRLGMLTALFVVLGSAVISSVGSEALERFSLAGGISAWIGADRSLQFEIALMTLRREPLLGTGVGFMIPTLLRGEGIRQIEAEYFMLLYKLGIVGFSVFMIPLAWLFLQPLLIIRRHGTALQSQEGMAVVASLLASLAILLSGLSNPYLTTPYTGFLIASFLAATHALLRRQAIENGGKSA